MNLGEFGDINLLKSITSFTIPLASLGLQQGLIRFLPQNNDEKNNFYNNIISFSLFYYLITSFFINFIVYIFRNQLKINSINFKMFVLLIIYTYVQLIGQILNAIDRAELNYRKNNLYSFFVNIGFFILFLLISFNKNNIIFYYFLSYSIIYFIINLLYLFIFSKSYKIKLKIKINIKLIKSMLKYGIPIIGIMLSGSILNLGDRFVINYLTTKEDLGMYSGMCSIANAIYLVVFLPISMYAYPKYMNIYKIEGINAVKKYLTGLANLITNIYIGALFFLCIFNKFVIKLFLNVKFLGGYKSLLLIFIGNVFYSLYYIFSSEFYIKKDTKKLFKYILFVGVLNIILNIPFVKKFGITGAALTTFICYTILFIIIYRKQDLIKDFLDIRKTIINIIFLFIVMIVNIVLKSYALPDLPRFVTLLVGYLIYFYYSNKNEILGLI
jgi:O-antigen/teichoic acid export membrane protein